MLRLSVALWAVAMLLGLQEAALAQESLDSKTLVKATKTGAQYELHESIDGSDVNEEYDSTTLVCKKNSGQITVILPLDEPSEWDGAKSTFKKHGDSWDLTFKIGKKKIVKTLKFVAIAVKKSNREVAAEMTVSISDPIWKTLSDPKSEGITALTGDLGANFAVGIDKNFKRFEKLCGLLSP